MLQELKERLTFANVVSVIALCVAVGGGYAVAFSGGGALDKARVTGLDANYQKVIELTGIGPLKAKCEGDVVVTVKIKNDSNENLFFNEETAGGGYTLANLVPGDSLDKTFEFGGWVQMYMHSREDDDRRPQVKFDYGVEAGESLGTCDNAAVSVLALTTEE